MAFKFLHLAVYFEDPGAPTKEAIQTILDGAKDWIRYSPNCWLIYTSKSAQEWHDKLFSLPGMKNNTSYFICAIDQNDRSGWIRKSVWDWINKHQTGSS
jgi:hypothetical protein